MRHGLYTELIPTLGPRAVPMLLLRLDHLLAAEPSFATTEVANCLALIESPEAIAKARDLLALESEHARSVALTILRRQGDPESLDRIWNLHLSATGEGARGIEYERRMDALAAGIGLQPRWLTDRLNQADATTPRLTDLVYQLARLPKGGPCWLALKQHLKAILPPDKRRSFIRCVLTFRDHEEIEFLRTETSREEDFVGDMARAALSRLDPDAALEDIASSNLRQIIWTRGWHFHPLLAVRPEAAQHAIRELVERRGERWALSEMYRGAENAIDVASFDIILDHAVSMLHQELASGKPDANSGPLHGPLSFIERIVAPSLVAALRARRGGELPKALGKYLFAIGPRDDISSRLTDSLALQVLQRIGDPTLTQWVNVGLRAASRFGRLDALQEAHKHADAGTICQLRRIALRADSDHERFESYLAVHALAQLGEWEVVVESVLAAGLSVSPYPFEERREQPALQGRYVEDLLRKVQEESSTPGLLLACALTRDLRFREPVLSALRADITGDVVLAGALAVELLGTPDDQSIGSLTHWLKRADTPERLPSVILALGTPSALVAVEELLRRRFDCALCAALSKHQGWEERAANLAWERRAEAEQLSGYELVLPLFPRAAAAGPRRYLEKLAFGQGGDPFGPRYRLAAARALGAFDPDRAFEAALGAARDISEPHRAHFPALLMELDSGRAQPPLLEMLRSKQTEDFELAVADALAPCELSAQIEALLRSDDVAARRAGCVLAARRVVSDGIIQQLRDRAVDVDETVSKAAMFALGEGLRADGILELAQEAAKETGPARWITLDHLVSVGRGTRDVPKVRPSALAPIQGRISPLESLTASQLLRRGDQDFERGVKDRSRRQPS